MFFFKSSALSNKNIHKQLLYFNNIFVIFICYILLYCYLNINFFIVTALFFVVFLPAFQYSYKSLTKLFINSNILSLLTEKVSTNGSSKLPVGIGDTLQFVQIKCPVILPPSFRKNSNDVYFPWNMSCS